MAPAHRLVNINISIAIRSKTVPAATKERFACRMVYATDLLLVGYVYCALFVHWTAIPIADWIEDISRRVHCQRLE